MRDKIEIVKNLTSQYLTLLYNCLNFKSSFTEYEDSFLFSLLGRKTLKRCYKILRWKDNSTKGLKYRELMNTFNLKKLNEINNSAFIKLGVCLTNNNTGFRKNFLKECSKKTSFATNQVSMETIISFFKE